MSTTVPIQPSLILSKPSHQSPSCRSVATHLSFPRIFYNQFINTPVFITENHTITNKSNYQIFHRESMLYILRGVSNDALKSTMCTCKVLFTCSKQIQINTIISVGYELQRSYKLQILPSIRQVATNGERDLPLAKFFHCYLKKLAELINILYFHNPKNHYQRKVGVRCLL